MRVIIIEDTVYKCSENIYKQLKNKETEINNNPHPKGHSREMELQDLIDSIEDKLKLVGVVEFDFRL